MVGFGTITGDPAANGLLEDTEFEAAIAGTIHLLLKNEHDPAEHAVTTAAAVRTEFTRIHTDLLELITASAPGTR